jgi:hypothetical protein
LDAFATQLLDAKQSMFQAIGAPAVADESTASVRVAPTSGSLANLLGSGALPATANGGTDGAPEQPESTVNGESPLLPWLLGKHTRDDRQPHEPAASNAKEPGTLPATGRAEAIFALGAEIVTSANPTMTPARLSEARLNEEAASLPGVLFVHHDGAEEVPLLTPEHAFSGPQEQAEAPSAFFRGPSAPPEASIDRALLWALPLSLVASQRAGVTGRSLLSRRWSSSPPP